MTAADLSADDRTFRVNFTVEGAERLRETVKEKLREFMGEYTDDTLVEYVIVLLRNGRRKDEARKELNVFLGDDCDAFIFWLWDHLSTSLPLYVESKESLSDETAKTKSGRRIIQLEHVRGRMQPDSEYDNKNKNSTNDTTKRRNREWKGLVQEVAGQFFHQSTLLVNSQLEEENNRRPISPVRQSPPRPQGNNRKRGLADEPKQRKRDRTSQPMMAAPRRLLQFAVRDAVSNVQQTNSKTELALKRLRSVVSTTTKDSILDEGPVTRSVARASGGLSTALKAAAEAAEDAIKVRYSSTVFDRLGNVLDKQEASGIEEPVLEGEINDFEQIGGKDNLTYYQKGEYAGQFAEDTNMLDGDTELASDSASYNDGYADVNVVRYHQGVDVSGTASSANKNKGSKMVQYTVGQDADEVARNKRIINQNLPAAAAASASRKIVNISVNVNTYESPSTEVVEKQNGKERSDAGTGCTVQNVPRADVQKEVQNTLTSTTGSYTTARPSDVDSRTVFVSNVHFAATKDNLSRHFNKFGEVLKVIIVTDAATGQPKGSAYVEFLRKESVELALSLNGTSFMSRIIKVVRRSSAHHDPSPTMWWPRAGRVSSYAARLGVPFPRGGVPMGAFRARLTVKPGARSLQWKRGSPGVQTSDGARSLQSPSLSTITSGNNVLSPTGRNLTYIRKET